MFALQRIFLVFLMAIFCALTQVAQASVVLSEEEISVKNNGVENLLLKVKRVVGGKILSNIDKDTSNMDRYMECSGIAEISGAYICATFYQADLNDAFTRMGIFMGAGKGMKRGTLLKSRDWTLKNYKKLVAGHNLPGEVINNFHRNTRWNRAVRLNEIERDFINVFVKSPVIMNREDNFYVIGLSAQSTKSQESVASHEIFHAQYLLTPNYKEAVDHFWESQVHPSDKEKIKQALGRAYNTEDYIVVDEFQAYLIQDNAEKDLLKEFVRTYRDKLIEALKQANVEIVRVKR